MTFKQFIKAVFMAPFWVIMGDFGWVGGIGAQSAAKDQQKWDMLALLRQQQMYKEQKRLNEPFYNAGIGSLGSLSAAINGTVDPNTGRSWTPETGAGFKWQEDQLNKNLNKRLSSLGRSDSTFGLNAATDAKRALYASEYDKQLGRLGDMVNIARGGANALSSAAGNYGNNTSGMLGDIGANNSNAKLAYYSSLANSMSKNAANAGKLASGGLFGSSSSGSPSQSYGVLQGDENNQFGSNPWFE